MFETVYMVKNTGGTYNGAGVYTVAKFSGRKEPDKLYVVRIHPEGWHQCSCPAKKGPDDKHVKMVLGWIKMGKPLPAILNEEGEVL